jgi:hypothetical protein
MCLATGSCCIVYFVWPQFEVFVLFFWGQLGLSGLWTNRDLIRARDRGRDVTIQLDLVAPVKTVNHNDGVCADRLLKCSIIVP